MAPSLALACGPSETLYLSCTLSNGAKTLEVCHDATTARYAYGAPDQTPELELVRPLAEVDLNPWPGVGRTISENVEFVNDPYVYVVYGEFGRLLGEDETAPDIRGGIIVERGPEELRHFPCDAGSVQFPWGISLFEAKTAAGQCYDGDELKWRICPPSE
ncbi:MAG: hypothetical protein ACU0GG_07270 [Paracoccaceae bacterium]